MYLIPGSDCQAINFVKEISMSSFNLKWPNYLLLYISQNIKEISIGSKLFYKN